MCSYLWAYITAMGAERSIVLYDCQPGRSGQYACDVLEGWRGTLVVDGYAGYQALFDSGKALEAGCWAHAWRKFFELFTANKSPTGRLPSVVVVATSTDGSGLRKALDYTLKRWATDGGYPESAGNRQTQRPRPVYLVARCADLFTHLAEQPDQRAITLRRKSLQLISASLLHYLNHTTRVRRSVTLIIAAIGVGLHLIAKKIKKHLEEHS